MKISMPFLSSLDNLLYQDTCGSFQGGVDCFEMEHKTCYFGVGGVVPLKDNTYNFLKLWVQIHVCTSVINVIFPLSHSLFILLYEYSILL